MGRDAEFVDEEIKHPPMTTEQLDEFIDFYKKAVKISSDPVFKVCLSYYSLMRGKLRTAHDKYEDAMKVFDERRDL